VGFPLRDSGPAERDRRVVNYAAKATWQATNAHRFDASFFGDPATGPLGPQRSSSLLGATRSAYSELAYGGHNQAVHYDGVVNGHLFLEASVGHALNRIEETPSVNEWRVRDLRVTPRIVTGGVGFYEAGKRRPRNHGLTVC